MPIKKCIAELICSVRSTRLYLSAIVIASVIALAATGIAAWVGLAKATVVQNQSNRDRIETELITIRPTGFEPTAISRVQGRFLLAVDNRSGLEEITLRLDRVAGNRLRDVKVSRRKLDWREFVDLQPGRYVLSEAAHPEWTCTVTITAR